MCTEHLDDSQTRSYIDQCSVLLRHLIYFRVLYSMEFSSQRPLWQIIAIMRRRYGLSALRSACTCLIFQIHIQVKALSQRIKQLGITALEEEHMNYALQATQGDAEKAFSLLLLLEDSIEGIIRNYTPNTKLLGAENRQGVTCYLDALLFAMFARLDCFEAILYKSFNDEPRRKLAILLRLWVNLLRSGKLITTDMVSYKTCGCPHLLYWY